MTMYAVEIIHEGTGAYMNFEWESEEAEDTVWSEIIDDLSVVVETINE